jgi:hypothetical protein
MRTADRAWARLALLALLLGAGPARAESLLRRALHVLGVDASSGGQKADSGPARGGRIFVADLGGGGGGDGARPLTAAGGEYRWPIFSVDGRNVIALDRGDVVTIAVSSGKVVRRRKVAGVEKLVGADRDRPDTVLVVMRDTAAPVALLSTSTGRIERLDYDPADTEQRRMLNHLEGEERVYSGARLFVKMESKAALEGTREWQEVYIETAGAPARAVSGCATSGGQCRQPALSADGARAVYVQVAPPG